MSLIREHDFEPVPGLPAPLPGGEFLRWQGRPDWRDLARSALHVRKLFFYFAALLVFRFIYLLVEGVPLTEVLLTTSALTGLAAVALGLLSLMAWLMARATVYTLTNRRIVIRSGVALPMTVNLPFAKISAADLRQRSNGFGDIPLTLDSEKQASWIVLWPHVRPWHFGKVQPVLRSLPDSEQVAATLGEAFRNYLEDDGDASRQIHVRPEQQAWPSSTKLHGAH